MVLGHKVLHREPHDFSFWAFFLFFCRAICKVIFVDGFSSFFSASFFYFSFLLLLSLLDVVLFYF